MCRWCNCPELGSVTFDHVCQLFCRSALEQIASDFNPLPDYNYRPPSRRGKALSTATVDDGLAKSPPQAETIPPTAAAAVARQTVGISPVADGAVKVANGTLRETQGGTGSSP